MEFRCIAMYRFSNHRQSANPDIDAQQGLEGKGFAAEQLAEMQIIIDTVADLGQPQRIGQLFSDFQK